MYKILIQQILIALYRHSKALNFPREVLIMCVVLCTQIHTHAKKKERKKKNPSRCERACHSYYSV